MVRKPESQLAVPASGVILTAMISVVLCFGSVTYSVAQELPQNNCDESWTAATMASMENANPWRTTQRHTNSGSRTVDIQRVEVLGPDGQFQPYTETETERVRVDDTTTHITVRTYRWYGNGGRTLAWVTEEEARSTATGSRQSVATTSSLDVNGNLQIVKREVTDTKTTSPKTRETETKLYLSDNDGGLTLAKQTQEVQNRRDDHTIKVIKKTLLPDGNGNWKLNELTEKTVQGNDKDRTTEERVSRPDIEGRLSEISDAVREETENVGGERSSTVTEYSQQIPGSTDDGRMHWTQRVRTVQKENSEGVIIEQQVEQSNPGNPSDGPQVTSKTRYTVQYGSLGSEEKKSIQVPDGNGTFRFFYVETRKSDQVPPAP